MSDITISKIPFRRYIQERLMAGLDFQDIKDSLNSWYFFIDIESINEIYDDMLRTVSPAFAYHLKSKEAINICPENIQEIAWLKTFGVFDLYRYNRMPPHKRSSVLMKNVGAMLDIVRHSGIRGEINKFLFNEDDFEKIAAILSIKYKMPHVSGKVIYMYRNYFWDTTVMTGSDAFLFYSKFRTDNVLLVDGKVKNLDDTAKPLIPDNLFFGQDDYAKWKAGYKVSIKSINDVLGEISADCFFKFKEAINTNQIIDLEESSGVSQEGIPYDISSTKKSNVQRESAKIAKNYLDMLVKAQGALNQESTDSDKEFFDRIDQMSLTFNEPNEKIASIDEIFEDVRGDI